MSDQDMSATQEENPVDGELANSQETDTSTNDEQSPVSSQDGHDDTQDIESTTSQPAPSEGEENTEQDIDEAERRAVGKLQQTQKELEALKADREKLMGWALSSPERAKQALIEIEGKTPEEAEQIIAQARQANRWNETQAESTTTQSTPSAPQVDPYKAAEEVLELREDLSKFYQIVPEMDPKAVTDDKREEVKSLAANIDALANTFTSINPSTKRVDAWVKAYKILTNKTDAEIEDARETGRLEGMATANSNRASTFNKPKGGKTASSGVALTDSQRKVLDDMRKMGYEMTDEEYAESVN